eukprot:432252_1
MSKSENSPSGWTSSNISKMSRRSSFKSSALSRSTHRLNLWRLEKVRFVFTNIRIAFFALSIRVVTGFEIESGEVAGRLFPISSWISKQKTMRSGKFWPTTESNLSQKTSSVPEPILARRPTLEALIKTEATFTGDTSLYV